MTGERPVWLLDVTRLASRLGRGPLTGIDRVELAYAERLLDAPDKALFLLQGRSAHLLLAAASARRLVAWARGAADLPESGWAARLTGRSGSRDRISATLASEAVGRATPSGLARLAARHMGPRSAYLNVGHLGLNGLTLAALAEVPGLSVRVMLHDTIPLDHPEFSGKGAGTRLGAAMVAVARHAGEVIAVSHAARADIVRWLGAAGRVPPITVAPLGVVAATPGPFSQPGGLRQDRPYFVALGTIEPRKDHALLLDVWDSLADDEGADAGPALCIVGRRGWGNAEVFRRLDRSPLVGRSVFEIAGMEDAAAAGLLAGSCGLLMPSRAEGFGLPVAEAAALGVPVVANDLPVYREIVGNYPIYVAIRDLYSWRKRIRELAERRGSSDERKTCAGLPTWAEHFRIVLGDA